MAKSVVIVAGPSAVGKTYLAEQLIKTYGRHFEVGKLFTTRQPRPGEKIADRVFLSDDDFEAKKRKGEFLIHDSFSGNQYAYPRDVLKPNRKHVIVNAWPNLIPNFLDLPDFLIVGLNVNQDDISLLKKRMQQRGDSEAIIRQRIEFIKRDISDLDKLSGQVNNYGKIFHVKDNQTVHAEVLPWLLKTVGLEVE